MNWPTVTTIVGSEQQKKMKGSNLKNVLTSSTCSVVNWSSIFALTKVNTRRKLVFTIGEGTPTSWMLVIDGILENIVDQFERILRDWFSY